MMPSALRLLLLSVFVLVHVSRHRRSSARAELQVLVSDGLPTSWMIVTHGGAAVANRIMTNNLSVAALVSTSPFNSTVMFGPLPDQHDGPNRGIFDRSHPKASGLNGLFPRWRPNLQAAIAPVLPLLHSRRITGIFVGDEIFCSNLPYSNYSAVFRELRALVGSVAVIWTNECGHPSGWPVSHWPKAPPELDWLSIDQYDVLDGSEEVQMAKRYWDLPTVKPKLWPHQKLLVVTLSNS